METDSLRDSRIEQAISMRTSGLSTYRIAIELGCSYQSVRYWLKTNGIDSVSRPVKGYKKLTESEKLEAIEMFASGKYNKKDIQLKFGISEPNARSLILNSGIENRRTRAARNRKYEFKEDYFEYIDNPSKAYLLGFYYADGNVDKVAYKAGIGIASIDVEILHFLKNEISHPVGIRLTNGRLNKRSGNMQQDSVHFEVCSKIYCGFLIKQGVVPNKSLVLEPPKFVPSEYINHFILGYFDGDGCICVNFNNKQYGVTFVGTKSVLDFMQKHICAGANVNAGKISNSKRKSDKTYRMEWKGRLNCIKIRDYLYKNSPFSLSRKREKFNSIQ